MSIPMLRLRARLPVQFPVDIGSNEEQVNALEIGMEVLRCQEGHAAAAPVPNGNDGARQTGARRPSLKLRDTCVLILLTLEPKRVVERDDNEVDTLLSDMGKFELRPYGPPGLR